MSNSNNDDWAMTRLGRTPEKKNDFLPEEDVFARDAPPPKNDDWAMTRVNSAKNNESKYNEFDQTSPNFSSQKNEDWDKTQANIVIPPNIVPKSNPVNQADDWGMTQANIQIPQQKSTVNLDATMYGVSPQNEPLRAQNQTYTPQVISQKVEQTASTNDATKWIYFLAGAFTMFVFMVFFLGIIYLLFLFK